MVFTHISVKGWIIDPYVQSLFYCSHLIQVLPPNNVEVVNGNIVISDVTVVIYGRGGFQMFLEPFTKSSWGHSNIFLITIHSVTLVSVDDFTLLLDWIFVFGESSGGSWLWCLLWSRPVPPTFCQCSWCSHWVHCNKVQLCGTSSVG